MRAKRRGRQCSTAGVEHVLCVLAHLPVAVLQRGAQQRLDARVVERREREDGAPPHGRLVGARRNDRVESPRVAQRTECGGCGLALACDLRLATPDAFFAIPPAKLGLAYSLADTKRLYDLVGPSRSKEILYTGRRILADEALSLGLVNEIVAAEALEERAASLAGEIAENAGNSVRAAKAVVNMITTGVLTETSESRRYYDESFSSPEFLECARAFIEKRRPRF